MGLFTKPSHGKHAVEKRARKHSGCFDPELKHIKDILKSHDTQGHLLPLAFHRHIKPPVVPPPKFLQKPEMVSGKVIPFTVTVATRSWRKIGSLDAIPEDQVSTPRAKTRRAHSVKLVKMGNTMKILH
ncbi:Aste57867_10610 [Aphanomyces stellatus]|uniref:Aste57867_10610 protein n=1 Tax=Aphanomyces stellatus TaxID=120398 RepID=A0A485KQV8_9STRA|nr:hypothetical protein As57867_010570 [Aphanomyces stellatus]VFT87482.1 Aste57867_10610 [Aphanomyces stellatus]